MSRLLGLDLALATHPAGSRIDRRQRVCALVRIRADHDHLPPSLRLVESPTKRISGGQLSLRAVPRSYQVTPKVLGRRRATEASPVRPDRRRSTEESARRQPENQPQRSDVTAKTGASLTVTALPLSRRKR